MRMRKLAVAAVVMGLGLGACQGGEVPPVGSQTPTDPTTPTEPTTPTDPTTPVDQRSEEAKALHGLTRSVLVAWAREDLREILALSSKDAEDHVADLLASPEARAFYFGEDGFRARAVRAWQAQGETLGTVRGEGTPGGAELARRWVFVTVLDGKPVVADLLWEVDRWIFVNLLEVDDARFDAFGTEI